MSAREWFEGIERQQRRVRDLKNEIESAYAQAGPHGQNVGSIGGGGWGDSFAGIDRMIDANTPLEYERAKAELEKMMDRATDVLYGASGHGGLAKARCSTDADIICCHYLQGMGWADIAREIVRQETDSPSHWCQMRARRALAYIDRVGMDELADS